MLNYAAGVMFPFPIAPPIITICSSFVFTSGYSRKRKHKFVNAPVLAHITLEGQFIIRSLIVLKLSSTMACLLADGIVTPPSPPDPCICSAKCGSPAINFSEPRTTITSYLCMLCNMSREFFVVLLILVFPAEVDIPSKLILELLAARTIAKVSSSPGSQSSQTFLISYCILLNIDISQSSYLFIRLTIIVNNIIIKYI